jgi:hypothetical protein
VDRVDAVAASVQGSFSSRLRISMRGQRRFLALVAVAAAGARLGIGEALDREHAVETGIADGRAHAHQAVGAASATCS